MPADALLVMHIIKSEDEKVPSIKINSYDKHNDNKPLSFVDMLACMQALYEMLEKSKDESLKDKLHKWTPQIQQ